MCLVIFANRVSPDLPLVVAANRDEFHARPTRSAHLWQQHPQLLAGQDLEQGGTWMGVTREGRFAAITNYRGGATTTPAPRSRGELPLNFLVQDQAPEQFLARLQAEADQYAGFNLLVGDNHGLWFFGNSDGDDPRPLAPGIYGLSNDTLDAPWPKVVKGRERLAGLLATGEHGHDDLTSVVSDSAQAQQEALAAIGQHTEMEQRLSSQFIITPQYGTRSTTTMRMDAQGTVDWRELTFDATGAQTGASELVLTTIEG